jgi:hypothetical protein
MVQPDAAGVIPSGPVSWYAVARPFAVSGWAGTMMSQLTFAVAAGGASLLVAEGVGVADGLADGLADASAAAGLTVE